MIESFKSDIDIDLADRNQLLSHIDVTIASMRKGDDVRRHNTGVYPTDIPYDPVNQMASLDYVEAENRGYIKLDLLNVHVYNHVRDEIHLVELMRDPDWSRLNDPEFVSKLIHLGNHYQSIKRMPEPINSIPRLAMFLAAIRPAKKHLLGKPWHEVSKTIWDKGNEGYIFKKSHSIAYSQLVIIHMNLLCEQESNNVSVAPA
jgi:hypothetical protein